MQIINIIPVIANAPDSYPDSLINANRSKASDLHACFLIPSLSCSKGHSEITSSSMPSHARLLSVGPYRGHHRGVGENRT